MIDLLVLIGLALAGWGIFHLLRLPVAPLLGAVAVLGTLRILAIPLPDAPEYITLVVQISLGVFIGTKVTRDTMRSMGTLALPATIISVWALLVIFLFGSLLSRLTWLDPYTAILASSMGGLPEMMVLAVATGADSAIIIVMQTIRMLATIVVFPILFHKWFKLQVHESPVPGLPIAARDTKVPWPKLLGHLPVTVARFLLTAAIAATGGVLLNALGVPAGYMLGSMLAVAVATLTGVPLANFPPRLLGPLLLTVGIMVTGSFSPETAEVIISGALLGPVLVSTLLIFLSSVAVSYLIHRLVGWDMPTSFLAAAPGGFTVMTALAFKYDKRPFDVSMLHLVRLIAIKTFVPLIFMLLL